MAFPLPGYIISIIMSFCTELICQIAFDAGGVASRPMTATFILAFAQGLLPLRERRCIDGRLRVIAMVAMTPLLALQILGTFLK